MGILYAKVGGTWQAVGGGGIDQATADARYVNVTGDTLTGALLLAADPSAALGAATKQYVDGLRSGWLQYVRYVPASAFDATGSGAQSTWLTIGAAANVPVGATSVIVFVNISGYVPTTTGLPAHTTSVGIGSAVSSIDGRLDPTAVVATRCHTMWISRIASGLVAGTQSVLIREQRNSGTGVVRADTGTIINLVMQFLP